jgi:SAM-dependent methyltransferase
MPADIRFGPSIPGEAELRLLGELAGRRVLELGCPEPANPVAYAQRGAKAIVVDADPDRLAAARAAADAAEVRIESHRAGPAELGFATSGSVDLVVAAGTLDAVDDLNRVFRQVHRVLKSSGAFVLAVAHPLSRMLDGGEVVLRRPYWEPEGRTVSGLFAALGRAGFDVEVMAEPTPTTPAALVPPQLLVRARKLGI